MSGEDIAMCFVGDLVLVIDDLDVAIVTSQFSTYVDAFTKFFQKFLTVEFLR